MKFENPVTFCAILEDDLVETLEHDVGGSSALQELNSRNKSIFSKSL